MLPGLDETIHVGASEVSVLKGEPAAIAGVALLQVVVRAPQSRFGQPDSDGGLPAPLEVIVLHNLIDRRFGERNNHMVIRHEGVGELHCVLAQTPET